MSDARTRYTRMVIRESFIQLHAVKPLSQITVKDICDRAQINRSTFYRNYNDVYDLKEQLESEMLNTMLAMIRERSLENTEQTVLFILKEMKQQQTRYTTLHTPPSAQLLSRIINDSYEQNKDRVLRQCSGISEAQLDWFFKYICMGCAGILITWVRRGMQEPPEEVARFIGVLVGSSTTVLSSGHILQSARPQGGSV